MLVEYKGYNSTTDDNTVQGDFSSGSLLLLAAWPRLWGFITTHLHQSPDV